MKGKLKERLIGIVITDYSHAIDYLENLEKAVKGNNTEHIDQLSVTGKEILSRVDVNFELEDHSYLPLKKLNQATVTHLVNNKTAVILGIQSTQANKIINSIEHINGYSTITHETITGTFIYIGAPYIQNVFETDVDLVSREVKIMDSYQNYDGTIIRKRVQNIIGHTIK